MPAVPEVFGVRLPPSADSLTSVDFDLVPNKPPPGVKLYDEEIEEVEESESDEDEDMEPAAIPEPSPIRNTTSNAVLQDHAMDVSHDAPFPISAIETPSDIDMLGTPVVAAGVRARTVTEEGSDAAEEEEGLFAGGDDEEEEESDAMEEVQTAAGDTVNGVKRKLVEEDDYD